MRVVVCSGKQWFSLCILVSRFGELLVLALLTQQQCEKSLHQPDSRVHPEHGAVRIELRPAVAGRERIDYMAADDQARRSPQYGKGNVPRAASLVRTSCFWTKRKKPNSHQMERGTHNTSALPSSPTSCASVLSSTARNGPISFPLGLMTPTIAAASNTT